MKDFGIQHQKDINNFNIQQFNVDVALRPSLSHQQHKLYPV
jgi:hypothetical protein